MARQPTYEELESHIEYLEGLIHVYNNREYSWQGLEKALTQNNFLGSGLNHRYEPAYGDLTELNTCRMILNAAGKDCLQAIAEDAIDLLQTSVAIYEVNGDYAFGMFSSGWCRLMDAASRRLCNTENNYEALNCGKWLCHDNCWNDSAREAIMSGKAADIQCVGGINLYAEPIYAGRKVVGSINIGYGAPPQDPDKIRELARKFQIAEEDLYQAARAYQPRPEFIINLAKKRLSISAMLIGQIVARAMSEQALKQSEEDFRTTFHSIGDAVIATDLEGCISRMNPAAEKLTGWPIQEAKAKPLSEVFRICNAFTREICDNPVQKVLEHGRIQGLANHTVLMAKHGQEYQIADSAAPIRNEQGELSGVVLVFRDVTEKYLQDEALRASDERLNLALQVTNTGLWDWNVQTGEIVFNEQWAAIIGYSLEELKPLSFQTWTESCHPDDLEASNALIAEHLAGKTDYYECEARVKHRNGSWIWILDRGKVVEWDQDGRALRMIGIHTDINLRKQAEIALQQSENRLRQMSLFDSLTGLYNRFFFEEEMRRVSSDRYCPIGIIVCDIDGLKLTNDALGHEQGDQLLVTFAKLLRGCFRFNEVAARIGGDEFAVLLPQSSRKVVNSCCKRIRAEVEYYNQQHPESGMSISIGSAVQDHPPVYMNKLYKRADKAMYKEKLQHSLSSRSATVQALIKTMEARDYITDGHAGRLQDYALKLGRFIDLPEENLSDLQLLARFHDLGKVGVPDQILFKPGPLSKDEYQEMKRHCETGQRIALSTSDLAPIADYILKHHEYWDGRGYPLGLKGREIPVECRILGIVDAYDAMISDRPYRRALSRQEALQELRRCAGTQFDPELVKMFILVLQENSINLVQV